MPLLSLLGSTGPSNLDEFLYKTWAGATCSNFIGLTMEQTSKLAKKSRLRYQVIDSIYTTIVPRDVLLNRIPNQDLK